MKFTLQAGLAALMVLGGCLDQSTGSGKPAFAMPKPAPEQISVSSKQITIAGPHGFCIDPTETKDKAKSAFVLLGSCAAISNIAFRPEPEIPAILMATVSGKTDGAPIATSMDALSRFFKSDAGRAALSRDGKAKTVEVIETLGRNGAFFIHARDSSTGTLAGAGDEYWRALFNVKGRIVSASVVGLEEFPISTSEGFDTLDAFTRRIRSVNAVTSVEPQEKTPAIPFLKRLFNKDPI